MISIPLFLFECTSRRGLWRQGSSKRELMNLIQQSGKLSFDVPWTKAENLIWSTMAPKRSRWIRWRYMTSVKSHSRSVTKVNKKWPHVTESFILYWCLHIFLHFTLVFVIFTMFNAVSHTQRVFRCWFLDSAWWRWWWGRYSRYTRVSPSIPIQWWMALFIHYTYIYVNMWKSKVIQLDCC